MRNVELWGSYPPPIGGVTIYLKRLLEHLCESVEVQLIDFSGVPKPSKVPNVRACYFLPIEVLRLLFGKSKIIHLNSFSFMMSLCFLLFGWRHKYGITIHNQRGILIKSRLKRIVYSYFLNRCDFIIMNDNNYKEKFARFFKVKEEKIFVLPAFIAPTNMERRGIPVEVLKFREKHSFLISANAFQLKMENGIDTYGLDMLIELIKKLRHDGINAGLLFCLPIIGDKLYYSKIERDIYDYGLNDSVLLYNHNIANAFEFWEISDLFIRPTATDMEGISVKEALYVGTHVVASDVCKRPDECIVFSNRDQKDLYEKVISLYNSQKYKASICYNGIIDTPKEILNIYQKL